MPIFESSFNTDPDFISPGDGASHTAFTIPLVTNNTCSVKVRVLARGLTDGSSGMLEKQAVIKSVSGGAFALVGAVISTFTAQVDSGLSTAAVNFSLSGASIIISVTGSATQRVGWYFIVEIYGFTNANELQAGEIP